MVEVAVVGAGPAGAIAAIVLARAGVRTLLLDRARFPRHKLCGDTLNPGAVALLRRLGLAGVAEEQGLPITGMLVTGPRGVAIRGAYGLGLVGRAIPRRLLDASLIEAAIAAGVQFQEGVAVRDVLLDGPSARPTVRGIVLTGREGRPLRIPALVTIAADGRASRLAFRLGLARHPPRPRRWAVGAYFEGVRELGSMGEMHVRGDGYLGVAPLLGGVANACLVTAARGGWDHPAELLSRHLAADPWLAARFAGARPLAPPTVIGPLAVACSAAGVPGLLLAGDAAGFVDPMTGDGLRLAMRGGELAAEVALECLEQPLTDAPRRLARRRAAEFAWKQRVNRVLRSLVASPHGVQAGAWVARLAPTTLRRIIAYAGDVGLAG